jgi:L-lactate dehydrogenase complex protein LldG
VSEARDAILARVRAATAGAVAPAVPRAYRGGEVAVPLHLPLPPITSTSHYLDLAPPELLDLLVERLVDYRARVERCSAAGVGAAIASALPAGAVGIPPGLPEAWRPEGAVVDEGLTAPELDALAGVVTGCTVAIAETGTLVLAAGPVGGRRALSLVPDLHVCVVCASQVVRTVPEAWARLGPVAHRPLTLVSGPSATSDIELKRVEGVHGPRTLAVVLVEDA